MITDSYFYMVAVPAVVLVGLSKGGFGGIALLAMPLLSLVISPIKAAAIMLPIMLVMDVVALWNYRSLYHLESLIALLPSALLGIFVGWLTATWVTDDFIRLLVGTISILFVLDNWVNFRPQENRTPSMLKGLLCGSSAGFTSFIAHAGAPPFQIYMLPRRLEPKIYVGTAVIFFAIVNFVKVAPYFALNQFGWENLSTSFVLMPLAPISTYAGFRIVKYISGDMFYKLTYLIVFAVGLKLVWDGISATLL